MILRVWVLNGPKLVKIVPSQLRFFQIERQKYSLRFLTNNHLMPYPGRVSVGYEYLNVLADELAVLAKDNTVLSLILEHCLNICDQLCLEKPEVSELDGGIAMEWRTEPYIVITVYQHVVHVMKTIKDSNQHHDFGVGPSSLPAKVSDETFSYFDEWVEAEAAIGNYVNQHIPPPEFFDPPCLPDEHQPVDEN